MISSNVRLVRMLGAGGMGSVWVADHLTLHTEVAVKFMSEDLATNDGAVARFTREATAAAKIKSPHVVQIFDHGVTENDGVPYIVMELMEGTDLGVRIDEQKRLPLEETALVLNQACKALSRAHDKGIIHRDIKPDNLFLTDADGEIFVKVLDFGIAKTTSNDGGMGVTSSGMMVGTPYYMSPEQMLSAKHVDFRSDLWALGIVTYHCIVGNVPFNGETLGSLCVSVDRGEFDAPSELVEGVPESVDAWFKVALARKPEDRFDSAKVMSDAFFEALGGASPRSAFRPIAQSAAGGETAAASAATMGNRPTFAGTTMSAEEGRKSRLPLAIGLGVAATFLGAVGAFIAFGREEKPANPAATASAEPAASAPAAPSESAKEPAVKPASDPSATPPASASAEPSAKPADKMEAKVPKPKPRTPFRRPPPWATATLKPPPPKAPPPSGEKDRGF